MMPLLVFLIVTIGGGLLIGFLIRPGEWYAKLDKPWFTPPAGIFAPVWTLLYITIAVAGWRAFTHDPLGPAMIVWIIALALNFSWSPIFFGLKQPVAAFCVIVILLATIILFIRLTWPQDGVAALLFVPYAVWTLFAALLKCRDLSSKQPEPQPPLRIDNGHSPHRCPVHPSAAKAERDRNVRFG